MATALGAPGGLAYRRNAGPAGELEALWDAKRANLRRPNSNAGEIGLLYAATLLASGAPGSAAHAREVFTKIEGEVSS